MFRYFIVIIDAVTSLIEFILTTRLLLRVLKAKMSSPLATWVYQTTNPLIKPFENAFPPFTFIGGIPIETSVIFTIIVYGLGGFLLQSLIAEFSALHKKSTSIH